MAWMSISALGMVTSLVICSIYSLRIESFASSHRSGYPLLFEIPPQTLVYKGGQGKFAFPTSNCWRPAPRIATRLSMPGMGLNSWGATPLYLNPASGFHTYTSTNRRQGRNREGPSEGSRSTKLSGCVAAQWRKLKAFLTTKDTKVTKKGIIQPGAVSCRFGLQSQIRHLIKFCLRALRALRG